MNFKGTWMALVGLCLAASTVLAAEPGSRPLFQPMDGAIAFERPEGTVSLAPKGKRWWVTGPDGRTRLADRGAVSAIRDQFSALRTVRPLGRFGAPRPGSFDSPVILRWGGQTIEFGDFSRVPGLVYVRFANGDIHLASPPPATPDPVALMDRRLFPDGLGPVETINVTGPDGLLHATKKFGVWRLTVPDPSDAEGGVIDAWVTRLAGLTGDPVAQPRAAGEPVELVLSSDKGERTTLTAWPGGQVALDGEAYRTDWPELIPDRFAWMEKTFLRIQGAEVTGVQVLKGDDIRSFSRGDDNSWRERTSGQAYKSWVNDLFGRLNPVSANALYRGGKDALGEPDMEVRLWQDAAILATIELWKDKDSGRWWARGGETVFVFGIDDTLPKHVGKLF